MGYNNKCKPTFTRVHLFLCRKSTISNRIEQQHQLFISIQVLYSLYMYYVYSR